MDYKAIVVGASAGGLYVLTTILQALPQNFPFPIIIVQHRSKDERSLLEEIIKSKCKVKVQQAEEKEKIEKGTVYFAPPNYHLLVEQDHTFSLSNDMLVNYSRPSIDLLFESAARVYKEKLIGIILTGANKDGAAGIVNIKKHKGLTIAQDPQSADYDMMPQSAIETGCVDYIMNIEKLLNFLLSLDKIS